MISDKVVVQDKDNACEGLEPALEVVEKTARFEEFGEEDVKTLRLLADEMVKGSAAILNYFSGTMWTQTEDGMFDILLEMEGTFTQDERERLIELTRDNKNTIEGGFFAKLGALLGDALTGEYFYPYDMAGEPNNGELLWESAEIAEMMQQMNQETPEDKEMRETAKKTLDTLADDVKVSARAGRVLITVRKNLPNLSKK